MDVNTNLKVSQLNVSKINVLSADIQSLSVGGSEVANKDFVLDVVALASKYAYKQLDNSNLSMDAFAVNRMPALAAGAAVSTIAPVPTEGAVVEWQLITDLTNLSASEAGVDIAWQSPDGFVFNWLMTEGSVAFENGKKYWTVFQAYPSLESGKFDVIASTKDFNAKQ